MTHRSWLQLVETAMPNNIRIEKNERLFRVVLPTAVFGLITDSEGNILRNAPIGWSKQFKHVDQMGEWAKRCRGNVKEVISEERQQKGSGGVV